MSMLTDIRADSGFIIEEWADSITVFRLTVCGVSTGGEEVETWYTNLITNVDIQALPIERTDKVEAAGLGARSEVEVYWKHGTDIVAGDRFRANGFLYYVNSLTEDEDKLVTRCSQRTRDDVGI